MTQQLRYLASRTTNKDRWNIYKVPEQTQLHIQVCGKSFRLKWSTNEFRILYDMLTCDKKFELVLQNTQLKLCTI